MAAAIKSVDEFMASPGQGLVLPKPLGDRGGTDPGLMDVSGTLQPPVIVASASLPVPVPDVEERPCGNVAPLDTSTSMNSKGSRMKSIPSHVQKKANETVCRVHAALTVAGMVLYSLELVVGVIVLVLEWEKGRPVAARHFLIMRLASYMYLIQSTMQEFREYEPAHPGLHVMWTLVHTITVVTLALTAKDPFDCLQTVTLVATAVLDNLLLIVTWFMLQRCRTLVTSVGEGFNIYKTTLKYLDFIPPADGMQESQSARHLMWQSVSTFEDLAMLLTHEDTLSREGSPSKSLTKSRSRLSRSKTEIEAPRPRQISDAENEPALATAQGAAAAADASAGLQPCPVCSESGTPSRSSSKSLVVVGLGVAAPELRPGKSTSEVLQPRPGAESFVQPSGAAWDTAATARVRSPTEMPVATPGAVEAASGASRIRQADVDPQAGAGEVGFEAITVRAPDDLSMRIRGSTDTVILTETSPASGKRRVTLFDMDTPCHVITAQSSSALSSLQEGTPRGSE